MTSPQTRLFPDDHPLAARQPKTDRLILARLLKQAADSRQLDEDVIAAAHAVLIRWADLESSGQLARMHESQLQGEFLGDVFGQALGYSRVSEGAGQWTLEQHHAIAGQTPDAILGQFAANTPHDPLVVVELKGPKVHLDRDRSSGRTAVQQAWDYLNNTPPTCRWAIVSNMVSFRLYERGSTPRRYEHFTLQELRDRNAFRRFFVLFNETGLIRGVAGHPPRAIDLLNQTSNRQREVGEELYNAYSDHRTRLIDHLHREKGYEVDRAIEIVQRLLDRVIFIAFCEDRDLLPKHSLRRAADELPAFYSITNPAWQNFKALFRFVDKGNTMAGIPPYNGGLFAEHEADNLELDDKWTRMFRAMGEYDFGDEVNLDVLGHLFEQSITELEKLREGGLFGGDAHKVEQYAQMPQSAKRKRMGIYYTPPALTSRIVDYTVDELIQERWAACAVRHKIKPDDAAKGVMPDTRKFWREAVDILRDIKIIDPACGSGAFLFQAYEVMEHRYAEAVEHLRRLRDPDAKELGEQIPHFILGDNLYGVDLSAEAVEITQLALWIRSATPGRTLATLSHNIVHGNSLVRDKAVHPAGFKFEDLFPEVFTRASEPGRAGPDRGDTPRLAKHSAVNSGGFDCVIGNPPWERIKLQEREFFAVSAPAIATATNAAKRRKLIAKLKDEDAELFARYEKAQHDAETLLTYCRKSGEYPLTGRGDINLYAVFAELAMKLVAPHGRVGLLTPSGIASDNTTKDYFAALMDAQRLIRLYDFENRLKQFFPDIDNRFKFCIINFGGAATDATQADFVFFAHRPEDLEDRRRHIALSRDDIKLLNPNTRTCPIFRTRRDAEITKAIYRRVPVLIDQSRKKGGNPWGVTFKRMFDQTNDAELFAEASQVEKQGYKLSGNHYAHARRKERYLPLYEAKMTQMYDHRAADVITDESNWVRQGQKEATTLVNYQNVEHLVTPRFWVAKSAVETAAGSARSHFLCYKDVTSPTNQRTMIAAFVPFAGVVNSAPIVLTDDRFAGARECCLLANLNSFAYDYVARQKISNVHLNFFIVEQVPTLPPDRYDDKCPWDRKTTLEAWISERVLKLTCTAEDMLPLAEACGFTGGSFKREYGGKLNKWKPEERAQLMAELDAAYFILYGLDRDDAAYILSTFSGTSDDNPLLPGHVSTADHILNTYDHLCAAR